jgi:outer membrane receptor protein involved in Fe transport
VQFERDHFQNLRWTHSLSSETVLTVSGYHHFNKLEVGGRADDPALPLAGDNRRADYYGMETSLAKHVGRHLFKVGNTVYLTSLRDDFSVIPNPANPAADLTSAVHSRVPANSWQESVYVQDQFNATERLSVNFGGRLDIFSAAYKLQTAPKLTLREAFFGPRAGVSYKLSDYVTVFANGAYLFLPPPIEFFEFRLQSAGSVFPEGVSFTPTRPERDLQYDVGVRLLVKRQKIRINQWFKRQIRFLDHVQLTQLSGGGDLINPNIFLPVNLDRGRTHGVEVFFETSAYRGLKGFVNYSLNYSQAIGGILYGFNDGGEAENKYFFVDHDQRHRMFAGLDYNIESMKAFVNLTYGFGTGFPDASDGVFETLRDRGVPVTEAFRTQYRIWKISDGPHRCQARDRESYE